MRKKVDSYLGFAAKSRNLISGYHTCLHAIKQKKLKLLILTGNLSENTVKKLSRHAADNGIPVRRYELTEETSMVTGAFDRGVFGVTDRNLADAILREIDGE